MEFNLDQAELDESPLLSSTLFCSLIISVTRFGCNIMSWILWSAGFERFPSVACGPSLGESVLDL